MQSSTSRMLLTSVIAALAPAAGGQGSVQVVGRPGDAECEVRLPVQPEDPSSGRDYNCFHAAEYVWNDGSGAGNVRGRVLWPSICGDGSNDPPGTDPLPTVLLMHGDGHDYTDYPYLVRHLALNGFIVATIRNDGTNLERAAQGLTYLKFLRDHWSKKAWVDPDNLGLVGHSRGGEAVLTLARRIQELGLAFDVNAVVSIAPTDRDETGGAVYHEDLVGSSSEALLVIYGTHDEDVHGYCLSGNLTQCGMPLGEPRRTGFSLYDRAGSEGGTEPFPFYDQVVDKALLFIEGANHDRWRETSSTCAFLLPGNLGCGTHQDLAKGFVNGFLRWQLRGQEDYRHYFTGDYVLPAAAADGVVVHTSYQEGLGRRVIDNFEQAGSATNTLGGAVVTGGVLTVEHDGTTWDYAPTSPHDTRSLVVSWAPPGLAPSLRFVIPDLVTAAGRRLRDVRHFGYLSLRAGQVHGSPYNTPGVSKDFWVLLRDSSGAQSPLVPIGAHADLPYPMEAMVEKQGVDLTVTSSAMRTVRIPLCRFEGVDLENVSSVFLYFTVPGSTSGELLLDNLELTY